MLSRALLACSYSHYTTKRLGFCFTRRQDWAAAVSKETTMFIPEFPECRRILVEDKPLLDEIFAASPPEVSAYTYTNLFAWSESYDSGISRVGDSIVVQHHVGGIRTCLEPLGGGDVESVVAEVFTRGADMVSHFERMSADAARLFKGDSRFVIEPDRANSDYVYLASDLIGLPGRPFDGKRNHISRFKSKYGYTYEVMTQEAAEECREFADSWCEERSCQAVDGLREEQSAVCRMLDNFDALGIRGGAIRVEGAIVAFALGEPLNPETLVVHAEKAANMAGLYQLINNEFCIHEAQGFTYVNREQDLGIPGLRKAKKSYHPVKMINTYTTRPSDRETSVVGRDSRTG